MDQRTPKLYIIMDEKLLHVPADLPWKTNNYIRDHRYTATDSQHQNEQGLAQEIMEMCLESMSMYYKKYVILKKYVHFILWQRPWEFERIFFANKRPWVLRRMGAVTEISGIRKHGCVDKERYLQVINEILPRRSYPRPLLPGPAWQFSDRSHDHSRSAWRRKLFPNTSVKFVTGRVAAMHNPLQ